MSGSDPVKRFLRAHGAVTVGNTPPRPEAQTEDEEREASANFTFEVERPKDEWKPISCAGPEAKPDDHPHRFIDGSHLGQPVLCLRSPAGYPVPLFLAQVGAVALRLEGRGFIREFRVIEQVLGFVADPFPWAEVEEFAAALENHARIPLRVLPARMADKKNAFDYEVNRNQARNRCQHEMLSLEVLALRANESKLPTLVDGQLGGRIGEREARTMPLLVGLVKGPTPAPLHERGWNALLDLKAGERTPYFKDTRKSAGKVTEAPLACWYLRLAGGSQLAPNWGVVRVDVPWVQLEERGTEEAKSAFINRLSQWLVAARCTAESYARMPISLEPIVRAEAALKPLFAPLPVLVNRLYHQTGVAGIS